MIGSFESSGALLGLESGFCFLGSAAHIQRLTVIAINGSLGLRTCVSPHDF